MGTKDDVPDEVQVGSMVYSVRHYTKPKRHKGPNGHGWVRFTGTPNGVTGRTEASAEVRDLVDEVVRLRDLLSQTGLYSEAAG